jgi:hypothetical protein
MAAAQANEWGASPWPDFTPASLQKPADGPLDGAEGTLKPIQEWCRLCTLKFTID